MRLNQEDYDEQKEKYERHCNRGGDDRHRCDCRSGNGTVPVVRAVGGLFDSIKPYGTEGENGFTFDNYNAHELLFTVKRALALYKNKDAWDELVMKVKESDFSWRISAEKYMKIYSKLLEW